MNCTADKCWDNKISKDIGNNNIKIFKKKVLYIVSSLLCNFIFLNDVIFHTSIDVLKHRVHTLFLLKDKLNKTRQQ